MATAVTKLNNLLQKKGRSSGLSWIDSHTGPANALQWTVSCKLDGQQIGVGTAPTKGEAKEAAALQAYQRLGGGA